MKEGTDFTIKVLKHGQRVIVDVDPHYLLLAMMWSGKLSALQPDRVVVEIWQDDKCLERARFKQYPEDEK